MSPPRTVDIHLVDVDLAAGKDDADLVGPEERDRARQFRSAIEAARFLTRRALARRLLARHMAVDEGEIAFHRGPFGKPSVVGWNGDFSTSHAGHLLLLAIGDTAVGCDLAARTPCRDLPAIAALCFTPEERGRLPPAGHPGHLACFYDIWTRKEALVKALGIGMSRPLTDIAAPDVTDPYWSVTGWEPESGYRASVIAAGRGVRFVHTGIPPHVR